MKIDQVFALHLYNHKQLILQGIGTFRIDGSAVSSAESDKEHSISPTSITFEYDPKAPEDPSLVDSIVLNTNKIKPLASADLDSCLTLGRQFMNIGKPFILEGIGTLEKTQPGKLDFKAGQFTTPKLEAPKALKENENEEKSGLFNDYNREPESNNKRNAIIIATVIILGIITWATYHFGFSKKAGAEKNDVQQTSNITSPDTLIRNGTPASVNNDDITNATNGYNFKVVFDITNNKQNALDNLNKLNNQYHHIIMYTSDSITYKLAEIFNTPLADTARAKDSLNKIYRGNVSVEIK